MRLKKQDYTYVAIQVLLFLLYVLKFNTINFTNIKILTIAGLTINSIGVLIVIIALLQLNKNLSPFPTPISGGNLVQNGLYKYIRHPIYTGILFALLGYSMYTYSVYKLLITFLLLILFFFKSKYEEKKLSQTFKAYKKYAKRTGRFFPKVFTINAKE